MTDLLVVGGGPIGLAAAILAARRGLTVTVWERRPGVLDKACGEGLMPGALGALREIGIDPLGYDIVGIRYRAANNVAEAAFNRGCGRGVRRTVLHAALMEAAEDAGVQVVHRRAANVANHRTYVEVDGHRYDYLIGADGLHSHVRRTLGLSTRDLRTRRFGQRAHFALAPWTDHVEVYWGRDCEIYVTPVAADLIGVAVLSARRASFDEHLRSIAQLDRLHDLEHGAVVGAGPLRQRASAVCQGRTLLIGDAAGYVDALTGEGIALGLAHAQAAIEAIAVDEPQRYQQSWRRATWRYEALTASLLWFTSNSRGRSLIVPMAQRVPKAFSGVVNVLAAGA